MQQKLIITLWKAQLREVNREDNIYCRVTYNNTERNSKTSTTEKNLIWKETYILPLAKDNQPLKIEFIALPPGDTVHFAKDTVAEALSFGKAMMTIDVESTHRGSLPVKLDVFNKEEQAIGKIFIEYQLMKTEVTYTVEKQLDYLYLLKLTNFKVSFVRRLKNNPKFYLHFLIEGREQKEILPFEEETTGIFVYNYPVKLYLKKQLQAQIILFVKEEESIEYATHRRDNQSQSSLSQSAFSEKKTFKSSIGKKDKLWLDLTQEKVSAIFDLSFKRDVKVNRKLPLTTIIKYQKRDIGNIQFTAETFFRNKEELQMLQEQKKGLNPEKQPKIDKKKSIGVVKQGNGIIVINSILGKLQLFNEGIISQKDMSMQIKLGQQTKESSILERPGKEIIFIDTFTFKRTWEETFKLTINLHNYQHEKIPTFFAELNLRELFQLGRLTSKKVKLIDEHRNYSGELVFDLEYRDIEEKKSPFLKAQKDEFQSISEIPHTEMLELKAKKKKQQIVERMRVREQVREKAKELNSMSTLAVLQDNDILLPPLRNLSRLSTIIPKRDKNRDKFKGAQLFNGNGSIRFSHAPRFESHQHSGYESYTYVRESDFDPKNKRGASIGRGNKYDFTKEHIDAPGVGRYHIQSVWDKYN